MNKFKFAKAIFHTVNFLLVALIFWIIVNIFLINPIAFTAIVVLFGILITYIWTMGVMIDRETKK
jgi:hypothetical protein